MGIEAFDSRVGSLGDPVGIAGDITSPQVQRRHYNLQLPRHGLSSLLRPVIGPTLSPTLSLHPTWSLFASGASSAYCPTPEICAYSRSTLTAKADRERDPPPADAAAADLPSRWPRR